MLVLISDSFHPSLPEKLAEFGEVTQDKDRLREAHVVLVRSKTKCNREYIDSAPNLKLIIRGGVGIDNIDVNYARSKGIVVHNTPKASSIAVAELTFALMLAVPNHLVRAHNSMQQGLWLKKELTRTELYGKTLCLVGLGNIATEVAKRACAFGMSVKAYTRSSKSHQLAKVVSSLKQAVSDADYVSLHVPLSNETKGMINADVIGWMKPGAVLINTARADVVVADDVAEALETGKLAAYATDVWPSDPPPPDYVLLRAPNVVMTPHIGASSRENLLRIGEEIVALIRKYRDGGLL